MERSLRIRIDSLVLEERVHTVAPNRKGARGVDGLRAVEAILDGLGYQLLTVDLVGASNKVVAQLKISMGCSVRQISIDSGSALILAQRFDLPLYVTLSPAGASK